jgi:hypothetical protein
MGTNALNFLVRINVETITLTDKCDIRAGDNVSICFESNKKLSPSRDITVQATDPHVLHVNQTLSLVSTTDLEATKGVHEKFYLILRRKRRNPNSKVYIGIAFCSVPYEK